MLTTLAVLLIGGLVMVLGMIGGVWWRQERIAYQPPLQYPHSPSNVRRIEYTAADGQQLFAFILLPEAPPVGVLLAFHGNADLAVWQIPWAEELTRRTGWCVILAEYRGYGGLRGEPSYVGVREDARAAWHAARRGAADLEIHAPVFALFGHSLGSAVATELAAEIAHGALDTDREDIVSSTVCALLLQSPFTSARDMVRIVSTRPVQLLWAIISRVHYDTRAWLRELSTPISIAHGGRDWLVPVAMGRELFTNARVPGQLLIVDAAGHNDVAEMGGNAYWQWASGALSAHARAFVQAESIYRTETLD